MSSMKKFSMEETDKGLQYLYRLREKYAGIGQDFFAYLEGLVQSRGLTYWEYVNLNSLLGLQVPRTDYKDEIIFITYHQITELYFKLIKSELEQLTDGEEKEYLQLEKWYLRMERVNAYFKHLTHSFDVMRSIMGKSDFVKFRMALLPASGFQSVQFRHIEIMSTNFSNLLNADFRDKKDEPLEALYEEIYWKSGSIDMHTGNKTLTLTEFEDYYDESLKQFIKTYKFKNLAYLYYRLDSRLKNDNRLKELLRDYDTFFNIHWRFSHLSAAARHLADDRGTGGTNWKKYLPPAKQRIQFFESLWTPEEKESWGEAYFKQLFSKLIEKSWMKIPKEEREPGA